MTHSHDRTLLASLGFADPDRNEPEHDLACRYLAEKPQMQKLVDLVMPKLWKPGSRGTHKKWLWPSFDALAARMSKLGLYFSSPRHDEVSFKVDGPPGFGGFRVYDSSMRGFYLSQSGVGVMPDAQTERLLFERHAATFAQREAAITEQMVEIKAVRPTLSRHGEYVEVDGRSVEARWKAGKPELESPIQKGDGKYRTTIGFADLLFIADESQRCQLKGTAPDGSTMSVEEWLDGPKTLFVVEVKARPVPAAAILRQLRLYEEYLRPGGDGHSVRRNLQLIAATTFKLPPGEASMLRSQGVTVIWLGEPFRRWVEEQERAAHTTDEKSVEEF